MDALTIPSHQFSMTGPSQNTSKENPCISSISRQETAVHYPEQYET